MQRIAVRGRSGGAEVADLAGGPEALKRVRISGINGTTEVVPFPMPIGLEFFGSF